MNLCTEDVPRLASFYKSVFGLNQIQDEEYGLTSAETANRNDGQVEFHIKKKTNRNLITIYMPIFHLILVIGLQTVLD